MAKITLPESICGKICGLITNDVSGGAGIQGLSQTILRWFPPQLQDCHHGCSLPSGQPFHVSFSWTVPRDFLKNTNITGKTKAPAKPFLFVLMKAGTLDWPQIPKKAVAQHKSYNLIMCW
jgi:hypothetical protein